MVVATKKKVSRKKAAANQVDAALVADIERKVRKSKSLARSDLPHKKLTANALAELVQQLVQRGLESGKRTIRVPIEEQLLDLLQGGGHVRRAGIQKLVKGAVLSEIDEALQRLDKTGKVRVVIRTKDEVLVGADASVLTAAEITRLDKLGEQLAGILKKINAEGGPRTLLRDDVTALFDGIQERVTRNVVEPQPLQERVKRTGVESQPTSRQIFDAKLRSLEDPRLKLVSIPSLVRSLVGQLSTADVHHALSEAAERGAIELYPDGGSEYLRPEDAALCPPGPRDTVFSRARLLSS